MQDNKVNMSLDRNFHSWSDTWGDAITRLRRRTGCAGHADLGERGAQHGAVGADSAGKAHRQPTLTGGTQGPIAPHRQCDSGRQRHCFEPSKPGAHRWLHRGAGARGFAGGHRQQRRRHGQKMLNLATAGNALQLLKPCGLHAVLLVREFFF